MTVNLHQTLAISVFLLVCKHCTK